MHRSRWIWPINGPDLIGISQSEVTSGVHRRHFYGNRDSDQRDLMRTIDQARRSTAHITSQYCIAKTQGKTYRGPEDHVI